MLSISIIVLIIGASLVYKNNIENEIASEKSYYRDYVDENGGMSYSSDIKAIHSFIEGYSHESEKVRSEVLYQAKKDLNDKLDTYLSGERHTIELLEEIDHVLQEHYVHSSNVESYEVAKDKAIENRRYILSLTDEDIEGIKKQNANKIEVGYSESQVIEKLGKPNDITTRTSAYSVSKMYEYDNRFIYFEDGKVTSVVDF